MCFKHTCTHSIPSKSSVCIYFTQGFPLTVLFGGHDVPLGLKFRGHFKFYGDIYNVKVQGRHLILLFLINSQLYFKSQFSQNP